MDTAKIEGRVAHCVYTNDGIPDPALVRGILFRNDPLASGLFYLSFRGTTVLFGWSAYANREGDGFRLRAQGLLDPELPYENFSLVRVVPGGVAVPPNTPFAIYYAPLFGSVPEAVHPAFA
jgi:hypothetical protein